jgi:hypothetical protein
MERDARVGYMLFMNIRRAEIPLEDAMRIDTSQEW